MSPPTDYMKFYCEEAGGDTIARVYTGPDQDRATYSGTIVVETSRFNRMLDALIVGVSDAYSGNFQVYFGPDERGIE